MACCPKPIDMNTECPKIQLFVVRDHPFDLSLGYSIVSDINGVLKNIDTEKVSPDNHIFDTGKPYAVPVSGGLHAIGFPVNDGDKPLLVDGFVGVVPVTDFENVFILKDSGKPC